MPTLCTNWLCIKRLISNALAFDAIRYSQAFGLALRTHQEPEAFVALLYLSLAVYDWIAHDFYHS